MNEWQADRAVAPAHGCVKVTYKDRLSRQRSKDGLDCEWGPMCQVKGSDGVTRNVRDDVGVTFIECPPRIMRREPQRENFRDVDKSADDDVDKHEHQKSERGTKSASSTSNSIRDLISKRAGKQEKLSEKAVAHWNALETSRCSLFSMYSANALAFSGWQLHDHTPTSERSKCDGVNVG